MNRCFAHRWMSCGLFVGLLCWQAAVRKGIAREPADPPHFVQTDVFVSGRGGYHTYRIPALVISAKGTLLAFCEGRKTSPRDDGDIDLLLRRSSDGGKTWQQTQLVHEEGGAAPVTIGNPCPVADGTTGTIHLLFCRNNQRAFHTLSTDDGATWATPKEITDTAKAFEFPWTRLASGPGHGLQLRISPCKDRLIMPMWLNDGPSKSYRSAVLYSDDAGRTWLTGGIVPPDVRNTNECMAAELPDGTLLLNMRAKSSKKRSLTFSRDGGRTWSTPQPIEQLVDPVCQAGFLSLTDSSGRPTSSLLFANPASTKRLNLTVRLSSDAGRTWPASRLLHNGPAAYSDLVQIDHAGAGCLYECGENQPYEKIVLARISLGWLSAGP